MTRWLHLGCSRLPFHPQRQWMPGYFASTAHLAAGSNYLRCLQSHRFCHLSATFASTAHLAAGSKYLRCLQSHRCCHLSATFASTAHLAAASKCPRCLHSHHCCHLCLCCSRLDLAKQTKHPSQYFLFASAALLFQHGAAAPAPVPAPALTFRLWQRYMQHTLARKQRDGPYACQAGVRTTITRRSLSPKPLLLGIAFSEDSFGGTKTCTQWPPVATGTGFGADFAAHPAMQRQRCSHPRLLLLSSCILNHGPRSGLWYLGRQAAPQGRQKGLQRDGTRPPGDGR